MTAPRRATPEGLSAFSDGVFAVPLYFKPRLIRNGRQIRRDGDDAVFKKIGCRVADPDVAGLARRGPEFEGAAGSCRDSTRLERSKKGMREPQRIRRVN